MTAVAFYIAKIINTEYLYDQYYENGIRKMRTIKFYVCECIYGMVVMKISPYGYLLVTRENLEKGTEFMSLAGQ